MIFYLAEEKPNAFNIENVLCTFMNHIFHQCELSQAENILVYEIVQPEQYIIEFLKTMWAEHFVFNPMNESSASI